MNTVSIVVMALFTLSVIGLVLVMLQPDEPGGDEDEEDVVWLAQLRELNKAMPYVHRHRAREAAREARRREAA